MISGKVTLLILALFTVSVASVPAFLPVEARGTATNAAAFPSPTPAKENKNAEPRKCPDVSKITNLCVIVANKNLDEAPISKNEYLYNRQILEASCAENDTRAVQIEKISKLWPLIEDRLSCNLPNFEVANGNILKVAVNSLFNEFLFDAARWKMDLNVVDKSDGRTLLDYISDQIKKNEGTSLEPILRSYYDRLKRYGAKHRSELPEKE